MCGKKYLISYDDYNFFFKGMYSDEIVKYTYRETIETSGTEIGEISGYIGEYFTEIYRFYKTGKIHLEDRPKYQILEILDEAETLKYQELINFIKQNIFIDIK
jgi:hypothetical protein